MGKNYSQLLKNISLIFISLWSFNVFSSQTFKVNSLEEKNTSLVLNVVRFLDKSDRFSSYSTNSSTIISGDDNNNKIITQCAETELKFDFSMDTHGYTAWIWQVEKLIDSNWVAFENLRGYLPDNQNVSVVVAASLTLSDQGNYRIKIYDSNDPNNKHYIQSFTVKVKSASKAPTGNTSQQFCLSSSPKVSNLKVVGSNIKWYKDGVQVASTEALVSGTYSATQTLPGGCESEERLNVAVNVLPGFIKPELEVKDNECDNKISPGSIALSSKTPVPRNAKAQYSVDNGITWSDIIPTYDIASSLEVLPRFVSLTGEACATLGDPVNTFPASCDGDPANFTCGADRPSPIFASTIESSVTIDDVVIKRKLSEAIFSSESAVATSCQASYIYQSGNVWLKSGYGSSQKKYVEYTFSQPVKEIEVFLLQMGNAENNLAGYDRANIITYRGNREVSSKLIRGWMCDDTNPEKAVHITSTTDGEKNVYSTYSDVTCKRGNSSNDLSLKVTNDKGFTRVVIEDINTNAAKGDCSNGYGFFVGLCPVSIKKFPDFKVTKTSDRVNQIVNVGDEVTYTIQMENTSDKDLSKVSLHDVLPKGVSYIPNSTTRYFYTSLYTPSTGKVTKVLKGKTYDKYATQSAFINPATDNIPKKATITSVRFMLKGKSFPNGRNSDVYMNLRLPSKNKISVEKSSFTNSQGLDWSPIDRTITDSQVMGTQAVGSYVFYWYDNSNSYLANPEQEIYDTTLELDWKGDIETRKLNTESNKNISPSNLFVSSENITLKKGEKLYVTYKVKVEGSSNLPYGEQDLINRVKGDALELPSKEDSSIVKLCNIKVPDLSVKDSIICKGSDAVFYVTGGNPGDYVSYSYGTVTGQKVLDAKGSATIVVSKPTSDVVFQLYEVSVSSCKEVLKDKYVTVVVNDVSGPPVVTLTKPTCTEDGSASITRVSGVKYEFRPSGPYVSDDGVIKNAMVGTRYIVTAVKGICKSSQTSFTISGNLDCDYMDDDENVTTPEDTPLSGSVLIGTKSPEGPVSIKEVEVQGVKYKTGDNITLPGNQGTVVIKIDGSYAYTPGKDYNGKVVPIDYLTTDGISTDPSTLNITVVPVTDRYVDDDENLETPEDTPLSGSVLIGTKSPEGTVTVKEITVLGKRYQPGNTITLPNNEGVIVINTDGRFTYTPGDDYNGKVTPINYLTTDGVTTDPSTLNITVTSVADTYTDDDEDVTTEVNKPINDSVLTGTTSLEGPVTIKEITIRGKKYKPGNSIKLPKKQGTIVINVDGSYIYTPGKNYIGKVTPINYLTTDGISVDASVLRITVEPLKEINLEAKDDHNTTFINTSVSGNVLVNDNGGNIDGLKVKKKLLAKPRHGKVVINQKGDYTYTPDKDYLGKDKFKYQVCDDYGNCAEAEVFITVFDILILNEFSANEDGVNDYFRIRGIEYFKNNKVRIYNRWGNLVFYIEHYNNESSQHRFEGKSNVKYTILRHKDLPAGTYYYLVDLGKPGMKVKKGWLYIQR